jgi:hypothetical protein
MNKYLSILAVEYITDFKIKLQFNDHKETIVDFAEFLNSSRNPAVTKYLKPSNFKKCRIENGDLMWGDFELMFPIKDLYDNNICKNKKANSAGTA